MPLDYLQLVETEFRKLYHEQPVIVRSPGRVNLIGEHTDYNLGFVLPAAIDKAIYVAIAPRMDRHCEVHALDKADRHTFTLDRLEFTPKGWPNYLMGVVGQLIKAKHRIRGFRCVFGGDIPIGAGLSSSAALEAGLAFALNEIFDLGIENLDLVKLAQKAENEFVGVHCGIMDQYANIFGRQGSVLRLDCRSLESRYYPFHFPSYSIVLFNTGVSHSLASSEYNRRREECAEGVHVIRKQFPDVAHLRDVTCEMLARCKGQMKDAVYRRCTYVVNEDLRVLRACEDLEKGNLTSFGSLMRETHSGLRDQYEVSCKELDFLVEALNNDKRVYGSRMMGAGFGGCTINLVRNEGLEDVCSQAADKYKRGFNLDLQTYVTSIGPGTSLVAAKDPMELHAGSPYAT